MVSETPMYRPNSSLTGKQEIHRQNVVKEFPKSSTNSAHLPYCKFSQLVMETTLACIVQVDQSEFHVIKTGEFSGRLCQLVLAKTKLRI